MPRPFPQFEDDVFESPRTFVNALIAWTYVHEADEPHVILVYDPESEHISAQGVYPDAYRANEAAVKLDEELNPNDGPRIIIRVIPFDVDPDP